MSVRIAFDSKSVIEFGCGDFKNLKRCLQIHFKTTIMNFPNAAYFTKEAINSEIHKKEMFVECKDERFILVKLIELMDGNFFNSSPVRRIQSVLAIKKKLRLSDEEVMKIICLNAECGIQAISNRRIRTLIKKIVRCHFW